MLHYNDRSTIQLFIIDKYLAHWLMQQVWATTQHVITRSNCIGGLQIYIFFYSRERIGRLRSSKVDFGTNIESACATSY